MSSSPFRTAMIVGGAGAVGSSLCRQLTASGVEMIYALDRRAADADGIRPLIGDVTALSENISKILSDCELVILALPNDAAERCIPKFVNAMSPGSLLVETLSVKSTFHARLAESELTVEFLGINPMFAPDLGFSGRPVLVVNTGAGPLAARFTELLQSWGASTVIMDADAHDRVLASLQVTTHAALLSFGLALSRSGIPIEDLTSLAPPPHRAMLALLARICSNDAEVYRDIQSDNPYASKARDALAENLSEIAQAIASKRDFSAMIGRICTLLGDDLDYLSDACGRMFKALDADEESMR